MSLNPAFVIGRESEPHSQVIIRLKECRWLQDYEQ
jgi:hypothetical protein